MDLRNYYISLNSMQHTPSLEPHTFPGSKEILQTLWKPKVHYWVEKEGEKQMYEYINVNLSSMRCNLFA
jgi:hypothetical protein